MSALTVRRVEAERSEGHDGSWSVGELARAAGLSVRVLRHWETLGLVRPGRTVSGHRRYGPTDITRLYRALALRHTGLTLKRVAALLNEQDPDPAATLRTHLSELDEELRRRRQLRDRLAGALAAMKTRPQAKVATPTTPPRPNF